MIAARRHGVCTNTNMAGFGLVAAVDGHFSMAIRHHCFGTSSAFLAWLEDKMNGAVQGFDLRKIARRFEQYFGTAVITRFMNFFY